MSSSNEPEEICISDSGGRTPPPLVIHENWNTEDNGSLHPGGGVRQGISVEGVNEVIPDCLSAPVFTHQDVHSEISSAESAQYNVDAEFRTVRVGARDVGNVLDVKRSPNDGSGGNPFQTACETIFAQLQVAQQPSNLNKSKGLPPSAAEVGSFYSNVNICTENMIAPAPPKMRHYEEGIGENSTNLTRSENNSFVLKKKASVNAQDALKYLDKVKYRFSERPEVYNRFLDIMKEVKSHNSDTTYVTSRVNELFQGHPDLILGFNVFLPDNCKISQVQKGQLQSRCHQPQQITESVTHSTDITIRQCGTPSRDLHNQPSDHGKAFENHVFNQRCNRDSRCMSVNLTKVSTRTLTVNTNSPAAALQLPLLPIDQTRRDVRPVTNELVHGLNEYRNQMPHQEDGLAISNGTVQYKDAVTFVDKVKALLAPEKYKQFLAILHEYQKQQKRSDGSPSSESLLTEQNAYIKMAEIFEGNADLLEALDLYVRRPLNVLPPSPVPPPNVQTHVLIVNTKASTAGRGRGRGRSRASNIQQQAVHKVSHDAHNYMKRSANVSLLSAEKKPKITIDKRQELCARENKENGGCGSENFDKFLTMVRHLLRPLAFDDFLRILLLYSKGAFSRSELIHTATVLLRKEPEALTWFKNYIRSPYVDFDPNDFNQSVKVVTESNGKEVFNILELDPSTCKRLGPSYCRMPDQYQLPICSKRTRLCDEVLNNVWITVPVWTEGAANVNKKMLHEEYMYRIEEERFEYDFVLQTNTEAINWLESINRKMCAMPMEQRAKFPLAALTGSASTIHLRAVKRIYGDERSAEIIDGLKHRPEVAIPRVLKRLRQKGEEWRQVQKECNKIWKEQTLRYYLKSLDHHGASFKSNDCKYMRPKSLVAEISNDMKENDSVHSTQPNSNLTCLKLAYNPDVLMDACELLLHHVRRQIGLGREEKRKIKEILKQFIPTLFQQQHLEMSDDEDESYKGSGQKADSLDRQNSSSSLSGDTEDSSLSQLDNEAGVKLEYIKTGHVTKFEQSDDEGTNYRLFFANQRWYMFLRLHHLLCDRLSGIREIADKLINESESNHSKNSVALSLREVEQTNVEDYYPTFLESVKNLLDGHIDSGKFEDKVRTFFGVNSYTVFTLDKLIFNAVGQLQSFGTDVTCQECIKLFHTAYGENASGKDSDGEKHYASNACATLGDTFCVKVMIFEKPCLMRMQLMGENAQDPSQKSQ